MSNRTSEVKDYYDLLGISRQASGDEIRKAFRRLARQFHPDLATDKSLAEEKFKQINEAYEVLGDPDNRRKYDLGAGRRDRFAGFGSRNVRPRNGRSRREGRGDNFRPYTERPEFRSFYDSFFGGPRDGANDDWEGDGEESSTSSDRSARQEAREQRGKDIEGEILVTLEEVLRGSVHMVSVLRHNPLVDEPEIRPLHVRVPRGVKDGQVLRLQGKGDYGLNGGEPGDLHLRIKIAEHAQFRVKGTDLYCDLKLSAWDAVWGSKKTITTLDGPVAVKIPVGTLAGYRLRLRGKGLPNAEGVRGDLYTVVSVQLRFVQFAKKVFRRR